MIFDIDDFSNNGKTFPFNFNVQNAWDLKFHQFLMFQKDPMVWLAGFEKKIGVQEAPISSPLICFVMPCLLT